ncbi:beta-N-acetylhexosaminidase [Microlunatus sagamiharensis]|uniref:Beta-N-acetylhexosaminidase n=2 Tax=Microlunatus sagamiharensis TaxID=546874 RepID=A0A1H2M636_9ACTN|nr:beta-N-acetylhexosaminidase [Microlunatus sagamiharensis]
MTEHQFSRRTALAGAGAVAAGAVLAGVPTSSASATSRFASSAFGDMALDQLVGQLVVYSYPGLTPPAELLRLIRAGRVGGLIFFGENITSTAQIAGVVAQLREAHAESRIREPLLLMTDQEGGIVRRLKDQEPYLSAKQIGQQPDPQAAATEAGRGAAAGLKAAGMNLNLAPVVDVYREEGNFDDQFGRSFSSDPEVAGDLGMRFATAQQAAGVAATAKHFPGLGAAPAGANTDLTAVTLSQGLRELRRVDEAAFVPSIRAGIDLVMASWAIYPALDAKRPAGLSRRVIQDELRGRLRFRGVTITDALEAGSLDAYGTDAEVGVLAARAGMDVLLCSSRDVSQGEAVAAALEDALLHRRLEAGAFLGSLLRVRRLRSRLH